MGARSIFLQRLGPFLLSGPNRTKLTRSTHIIMSHDRSQIDSLNHIERGVVNLMWLTLIWPYVVRTYEEDVQSLYMVRAYKDYR
jgi:hypothetical protein